LDPDKMATLGLDVTDVLTAISEQNLQVAAGQIGQPPAPKGQQFQLTINTLGRLTTPEEFGDIILKAAQGNPQVQSSPTGMTALGTSAGSSGPPSQPSPAAGGGQRGGNQSGPTPQTTGIVRLRDVVTRAPDGRPRVELGAQQYEQSSTLDGQPSVALSIYQLPGSNALDTAKGIYAKMEELKTRFPDGLDSQIIYDTTPFISESVAEVFRTLRDAVILVAIVVLVFLQNWRAALIPLIAVPVAIVGTFAVMAALGYSLNNLSLFGLVLAIGIVVDDAIVVVENVERWLEHGLPPREAARKAMDEVTG